MIHAPQRTASRRAMSHRTSTLRIATSSRLIACRRIAPHLCTPQRKFIDLFTTASLRPTALRIARLRIMSQRPAAHHFATQRLRAAAQRAVSHRFAALRNASPHTMSQRNVSAALRYAALRRSPRLRTARHIARLLGTALRFASQRIAASRIDK